MSKRRTGRPRPGWPRGTRWLAAGITALLLAVVLAWVLFVPAADWLAHHDVGSVKGPLHETALDNARGRLLTLGAGLFAAGALVFTARNFTVSRRTLDLTEQGQVTDRYTKAIEQLGSDKLDVRIGGIYALERVGRDSAKDQPTVMEVLTAFIREHSREPWPPPDSGGRDHARSTRPDVQAALTVIGRRISSDDLVRIDLTGANLTGARLTHAVLDYANLTGTNLTGAGLFGALLTGALLTRADLTGAVLIVADLTYADLTGAVLTGAILSDDLSEMDLSSAVLTGANWPEDKAVPAGWKRDPDSGLLSREN
jgi:hypothetical protein